MTWSILLGLILKEGLPLALDINRVWSTRKGEAVSVEEFKELEALASKTSRSQMLEALARAGIDPESEQGKKLLGLV